jgi:hypothetical protein
MGQQTNKIIKRRRRIAYLERKKAKAIEAAATKSKPRRNTGKKATAPAEVASAAE